MPNIKNKKVVFISAVGGDIGNTCAKSISGEEFLLVGCDMKPLPCQNLFLEQFFQVPPASQAREYFDAMKNIIKKANVDLIVPISEAEIKTFHDHRKVWSSWKVKVLINNECILNNFLDKYNTVTYLAQIGIKVPKTYLLQDYQGQLDFPMIIKRRIGWGSKNVWKVESDIDLDYFRQKNDGTYLIQECIGQDDQEYTTGIFSDGNNISSITFKRKLGLGGLSVEVELADSPVMDRLAQKIARKTNLIGSINVQTRLRDGTFIPFEINPRFSSTVGFRKQFGFSDCLWWPRFLLGKEYSYKRQYKSGRGVRYLTESYAEMNRI